MHNIMHHVMYIMHNILHHVMYIMHNILHHVMYIMVYFMRVQTTRCWGYNRRCHLAVQIPPSPTSVFPLSSTATFTVYMILYSVYDIKRSELLDQKQTIELDLNNCPN